MIQINDLYTLLNELRDTYRQLLINSDKVVQGNPRKLADNVIPIILDDDSKIQCIFNMPAEWKYIEYGSRPHFPPPSAIKDWIEQKPLVPRPDSRGRVPTTKQLAFLVGRKIAIEGIEPNPLLEEAIIQTDFYNRAINIIKRELSDKYNREIKEIMMYI